MDQLGGKNERKRIRGQKVANDQKTGPVVRSGSGKREGVRLYQHHNLVMKGGEGTIRGRGEGNKLLETCRRSIAFCQLGHRSQKSQ